MSVSTERVEADIEAAGLSIVEKRGVVLKPPSNVQMLD